jgi:Fumarylacetoacetate (FAA) hydrolase family
VKLCMFHPVDHPMERGWPGRVDAENVVELAAQTLQAYFTGGGAAREHAVFPIDRVQFLAPVLHPPAVRVFENESSFEFANPAAIMGPDTEVAHRAVYDWLPLELRPRVAAVIADRGEIGGFTIFADWRAPDLPPPKDRDFALGLGPLLVTPDEALAEPAVTVRVFGDVVVRESSRAFNWTAARDVAAAGTTLKPGDVLAGPACGVAEGIEPATVLHVEVEGIGVLTQSVHPFVETQ